MIVADKRATTDADSPSKAVQPSPNCVAVWFDLMRTTDKFLLAGMRRRIGPEGDLQATYRRWYDEHMLEHDEYLCQLMRRLRERSQEPADAR